MVWTCIVRNRPRLGREFDDKLRPLNAVVCAAVLVGFMASAYFVTAAPNTRRKFPPPRRGRSMIAPLAVMATVERNFLLEPVV